MYSVNFCVCFAAAVTTTTNSSLSLSPSPDTNNDKIVTLKKETSSPPFPLLLFFTQKDEKNCPDIKRRRKKKKKKKLWPLSCLWQGEKGGKGFFWERSVIGLFWGGKIWETADADAVLQTTSESFFHSLNWIDSVIPCIWFIPAKRVTCSTYLVCNWIFVDFSWENVREKKTLFRQI